MSETEASKPPPFEAELSRVRQAAGEGLVSFRVCERTGDCWITITRERLIASARALRDDPRLKYGMLIDLFGVDRPEDKDRIHVYYQFLAIPSGRRVYLVVKTSEGQPIPTISSEFASADWAEREVAEMFGIEFGGHPDPRPILLPDDWVGFPLRKDYPLVGRRPVILYNNVKDIL